jgi:hypothetical protein
VVKKLQPQRQSLPAAVAKATEQLVQEEDLE